MKKLLVTLTFVVILMTLSPAAASAARITDTVEVGLRYGSTVLEAANLENAVGEGYEFGWFDDDHLFHALDETEETTITMSPSGHGTILVTVTGTDRVLYESDDDTLGVMPMSWREEAVTWFKGYRYRGGFRYALSGSGVSVVNVVHLEDYVKGVIPHEMNGNWPLAALEAQAVCARTFACGTTKHSGDGFDVCASNHCQVYNGVVNATATSDEAVDNTAGECLYYDRQIITSAVYHSSNGGATEDGANVWGGETGYLIGKEDPYEAETSIPNYNWSVTYTAEELTWILDQKGYDLGTVKDVYVSKFTPLGNVEAVTIEGSRGSRTFSGQNASSIFYSSTYGKSVPSLRFTINGAGAQGGGIYVNSGKNSLPDLEGAAVISGGGQISTLPGSGASAISASGVSDVTAGGSGTVSSGKKGTFTFTGAGNGHNVGMSQYGAKAMAELGYDYQEILTFYYTDITIR